MTAGNEKNIVVAGAGYGGITAVLRLANLFHKRDDYQVHLIDKNPFHTLKTQLHEAAVRREEVRIPMHRIIAKKKIIFHLGEITKIDPDLKIISLGDKKVPFEYVVLALGSQANFHNIPGLAEHALTLQSFSDAQKIHSQITQLCALASSEPDEQKRRDILRYVIGGGGLAGIEFAAELADMVQHCTKNYHRNPDEAEVIIVEAADKIVPFINEAMRSAIEKRLQAKRIRILTKTKIVNCAQDEIVLDPGGSLNAKTLIWTGGIRASDLVQGTGMKTGAMGRILVDEYLRGDGYPFVYAIGDNALAMNPETKKPVPTAAQFALQQGRLVAGNIYAAVTGKPLRAYKPKVWGEVIGLGRHLAVGFLALPLIDKFTFVGFLGRLLKAATQEKHLLLLRKESRNWMGLS